MGRKVSSITVGRMPRPSCTACSGLGSVRMTIHFHSGDREWEAPCWSCFGNDLKVTFPTPKAMDN